MFIRLVVTRIDEDSNQPQGLFSAAYELLESGNLDSTHWKHLRETLDWFKENLPGPPERFGKRRATFWFESEAKESIDRMWDLAHILRAHDYFVEVQKCRRLANIAYEDDFQVAAYPSVKDDKRTVQ
jgi:hypothetical protein